MAVRKADALKNALRAVVGTAGANLLITAWLTTAIMVAYLARWAWACCEGEVRTTAPRLGLTLLATAPPTAAMALSGVGVWAMSRGHWGLGLAVMWASALSMAFMSYWITVGGLIHAPATVVLMLAAVVCTVRYARMRGRPTARRDPSDSGPR